MNQEVAIPDLPHRGPEIVVFDETATRGDKIFELSERIPQSEFGLPEFFVRSDLLPEGHITEEDIDSATVPLNYYEGYPALPSGASFWNQLPHEPRMYFELFQKFLDQVGEIGLRQLDMLSVTTDKTLEELSDIAREFYWTSRARAYDMFIVAAEAKRREYRIRSMENKHFDKTEKLFNQLMERFIDDGDDSWIEELNAKEAIEALETLVKIQRLSVGLTGQHASSNTGAFEPGESGQDMLRKIAQNAGVTKGNADKFASQLQSLLNDPEEGATLQAAIIKVTAPNNRTTFQEDL